MTDTKPPTPLFDTDFSRRDEIECLIINIEAATDLLHILVTDVDYDDTRVNNGLCSIHDTIRLNCDTLRHYALRRRAAPQATRA